MKTKKSVTEAALEEFNNVGKPLHYKELTRRIIHKCNLVGKTPHETVRSRIGTDERFIRVAEGVYALVVWKEYPVARFAKDIAYDILQNHGSTIDLSKLGERIFEERVFKGPQRQVARNAIRNDERFSYEPGSDLVSLVEWEE